MKTLVGREKAIKERLLKDAEELIERGGIVQSRQIEALAGAVAIHLAALESVLDQRTSHLI